MNHNKPSVGSSHIAPSHLVATSHTSHTLLTLVLEVLSTWRRIILFYS